jgi:hypothetical protein
MAKHTICIISEDADGLFETELNQDNETVLVEKEYDIDFKNVASIVESELTLDEGEETERSVSIAKLTLKNGTSVYITSTIQENIDLFTQEIQNLIEELSTLNNLLVGLKGLSNLVSEDESYDSNEESMEDDSIQQAA